MQPFTNVTLLHGIQDENNRGRLGQEEEGARNTVEHHHKEQSLVLHFLTLGSTSKSSN